MLRFLFFISTFLFIGCGTEPKNNEPVASQFEVSDTSSVFQITDSIHETKIVDTTDYENATYYFVIADTNFNYPTLYNKMFSIHKQLNIPIDTLGRFYNKKKDLIALPDNDEDEIYAGDYFPRRYPSEFLSLEYLDFYSQKSSNKTIALMAGIFESEQSADSLLSILKPIEKKSFKLKAKIYIGCMH